MNTTTCNAKTCIYFGNILILNKKDTFDNAKRIIHMKRKGNKTEIKMSTFNAKKRLYHCKAFILAEKRRV